MEPSISYRAILKGYNLQCKRCVTNLVTFVQLKVIPPNEKLVPYVRLMLGGNWEAIKMLPTRLYLEKGRST